MRAIVDDITDVPAAVRGEYTIETDGRWHLAITDLDAFLKPHRDGWAKEKTTLEGERDALLASERDAAVNFGLGNALTKAGLSDEWVDLLTEKLGGRLRFETDGAGRRVLRVLSADGETPMIGSAKDGRATLADLAKEAAANYPTLFKPGESKPKPKGGETVAAGTVTRAEWDAMGAQERADRMRAGAKVVDNPAPAKVVKKPPPGNYIMRADWDAMDPAEKGQRMKGGAKIWE
jgi:hypothetical protein